MYYICCDSKWISLSVEYYLLIKLYFGKKTVKWLYNLCVKSRLMTLILVTLV